MAGEMSLNNDSYVIRFFIPNDILFLEYRMLKGWGMYNAFFHGLCTKNETLNTNERSK